jgi:hypothetical protein
MNSSFIAIWPHKVKQISDLSARKLACYIAGGAYISEP